MFLVWVSGPVPHHGSSLIQRFHNQRYHFIARKLLGPAFIVPHLLAVGIIFCIPKVARIIGSWLHTEVRKLTDYHKPIPDPAVLAPTQSKGAPESKLGIENTKLGKQNLLQASRGDLGEASTSNAFPWSIDGYVLYILITQIHQISDTILPLKLFLYEEEGWERRKDCTSPHEMCFANIKKSHWSEDFLLPV